LDSLRVLIAGAGRADILFRRCGGAELKKRHGAEVGVCGTARDGDAAGSGGGFELRLIHVVN